MNTMQHNKHMHMMLNND